MNKPLFTVVMPSYLGSYPAAAANRDEKIIRAINSVLNQSCQDFELFIIADGCEKTMEIVSSQYINELQNGKIRLSLIAKQKLYSGRVRNFGIHHGRGLLIAYLDIDDVIGKDHLAIIASEYSMETDQFVFFNDYVANSDKTFYQRSVDIENYAGQQSNNAGTSNIAHLQALPILWEDESYQHDWRFITSLKKFSGRRIKTPQYYVCHVPNQVDV